MKVHKEGYKTIFITLTLAIIFSIIALDIFDYTMWAWVAVALFIGFTIFILSFFRVPVRVANGSGTLVSAPADGKVVIVEELEEPEYFKGKRLQLSIFMSPFNVHVNRYPMSGTVKYVKYHEGLYLVAWHPKSSTDNERSTVVVENEKGTILFRQIAGALARRIVYYAKEGDKAEQGKEFGFIKFGSRVDIFLPIGTKVNVKLDEVVRGGETVIASWE